MQLEKYSMGLGDRFAHQGRAQLQAFAGPSRKESMWPMPSARQRQRMT